MHTGLMMAAAVSGILFLYQFIKWNKLKRGSLPLAANTDNTKSADELVPEQAWWSQLDSYVQLQLAVALAGKAMPVWQKYSESNYLAYKNSPISNPVDIKPSLLTGSLEEVEKASASRFPENNRNIADCYNEFVAPLIALQDGHWVLSYPVKKIFLAVYNILKAIAAQEEVSLTKHLLSLSINQSLDCLDMCRLYSREEIHSFLQSYRVPL